MTLIKIGRYAEVARPGSLFLVENLIKMNLFRLFWTRKVKKENTFKRTLTWRNEGLSQIIKHLYKI